MPDDGAHPYVGQLLAYLPETIDSNFTDPGYWTGCSGKLISPKVVVTARHCVAGVGLNGTVTPDCTSYPGGACGEDVWITFSEVPDPSGLPRDAPYIPDNNAPSTAVLCLTSRAETAT